MPGYQGQQEIVCLVGCKRASLWEGGGLNGRLSPRRKESHWISSLTVRFATTKSPVKLPCELCCVRDRIIQVILKESKFSSINLQISAVRPNPFNPFALTKTVSGKSSWRLTFVPNGENFVKIQSFKKRKPQNDNMSSASILMFSRSKINDWILTKFSQ